MIEFIHTGLQYGLMGGIAVIIFLLVCILLSPAVIIALGFISTILNIGKQR